MTTLSTPLRRQLENTVKQAREMAESGARKALKALAVHEPDPFRHMTEAQRDLRRKLRAQAKQLGDGESQSRRGAYEIGHLAEKLAYDQWHRLLFARYLIENNLLLSPEHGVSVSLDDCEELAPSENLKDAWAVAARFAAKELPQIFRADDPAGAVELPVENRRPLIDFVVGLPVEVFTARDSLGWCYQFWQAEKKDEVNASGNKIGADELPAVTQLFTEDYMVDFLLDNTLGAWHAGKVLAAKPSLADSAQSEDELRQAVALPGCPWKYLRFIRAEDGRWAPAAGVFSGWPGTARELKCLDPCMGSGHFIVAMFERLVALRVAEERVDEAAAVSGVIERNLFGLEIDPRCTQIAAFNLALAAWRRVGHCALPAMNLACSGVAPNAKREDWLKLAGDDDRLQRGMAGLHSLFNDAPVLGSLIDPRLDAGDMFVADYHEIQPLLERALIQETKDDSALEMKVAARGLARAAETLADLFTLVATNVPYLGRGKQNEVLQVYCERVYPEAKADLATCFVARCLDLCAPGASVALVTPQNWLFLSSYQSFRASALRSEAWMLVARLGANGFSSIGGEVVQAALPIISRTAPQRPLRCLGIDAASAPGERTVPPEEKACLLRGQSSGENLPGRDGALKAIDLDAVLCSPGAAFTFSGALESSFLCESARSFVGMQTGDSPKWIQRSWEQPAIDGKEWWPFQLAPEETKLVDGCVAIIRWGRSSELAEAPGARIQGIDAWGKRGVLIQRMSSLKATLYHGQPFDTNTAALIPDTSRISVATLFSFCSSPSYAVTVRDRAPGLSITNQALVNIPYSRSDLGNVAPASSVTCDPTQWLFSGHPADADQPLHVGLARLLGYQWPRQTGSSFPDCPALSPDGLEKAADDDGIVCLAATKGEGAAAERLRALLAQALGTLDLAALIASAGPGGSKSETLDEWLRDEFFEQHCALFHNRPFIWQVWDGHKSGFSALVNYHKLTHANLENLIFGYLGDWIRRQQAALAAGEAGSDARLEAAQRLQARLKLILEGEPPYDLFVRWKPLSEQAIGWHPDINDGVRMNIRPFLVQDIPGGKRGAGILRCKPNIKWEKDRGKEPVRSKEQFPWFWGWDEKQQDFKGVGTEPDGNRWNNCHYTNAFKKAAREGNKMR